MNKFRALFFGTEAGLLIRSRTVTVLKVAEMVPGPVDTAGGISFLLDFSQEEEMDGVISFEKF